MKKLIKVVLSILLLLTSRVSYSDNPDGRPITTKLEADLCIYGASGAGIAAAVAGSTAVAIGSMIFPIM